MKPCDFCCGWFAICLHQAEYGICWKGLKEVKYIMKKQQWHFIFKWKQTVSYFTLNIIFQYICFFVHKRLSLQSVRSFLLWSSFVFYQEISNGYKRLYFPGYWIGVYRCGGSLVPLAKKELLVYMEEMHFIAWGLWLVSRKIV